MTQTIQNYADNSLLSQACYSNFNVNKKDYKAALMHEDGAKFTELQATDFLSKYEIAYHYPNDETGLSFTVFREKTTGKLTLACRGTEMETDFINDAVIADTYLSLFSNLATHQGVNLYNALQFSPLKKDAHLTRYKEFFKVIKTRPLIKILINMCLSIYNNSSFNTFSPILFTKLSGELK